MSRPTLKKKKKKVNRSGKFISIHPCNHESIHQFIESNPACHRHYHSPLFLNHFLQRTSINHASQPKCPLTLFNAIKITSHPLFQLPKYSLRFGEHSIPPSSFSQTIEFRGKFEREARIRAAQTWKCFFLSLSPSPPRIYRRNYKLQHQHLRMTTGIFMNDGVEPLRYQ